MRSVCSIALAVASTVLFELAGGVSTARSLQFLLAAFLSAVLAALHTHAVLGKSLSGWKLYQPFYGGKVFVVLQALGWMVFGFVTLGCLCAIILPFQLNGLMCALGVVQLLSQAALLLSLPHFDSTQAKKWSEKGIPLPLLAAAIIFWAIVVGSALHAGGAARQGAGWAILMTMLTVQAIGLHYMWTITWNFMTIGCYLIGSEEALAVMAVIGICSICAPWYIGRIFFRKYDFCRRAMIGQSAWVCDEILCFKGRHYMHKVRGGIPALRSTFWHFDTVLHLLAALLLLQQYAWSIRPITQSAH
jgi:hypothetical protein